LTPGKVKPHNRLQLMLLSRVLTLLFISSICGNIWLVAEERPRVSPSVRCFALTPVKMQKSDNDIEVI
jgi:hypothetical protein